MTFAPDILQAAHKHCTNNRVELAASGICGCFYCGAAYSPSEIELWVPEDDLAVSQTAVCSRCSIDSVIGSVSGFPVEDPVFLSAMHAHWFERVVHVAN